MSSFIRARRIAWGAPEAEGAESGRPHDVRAEDAELHAITKMDHFESRLSGIARAYPALRCDAVLELENRAQWFFRAADGQLARFPIAYRLKAKTGAISTPALDLDSIVSADCGDDAITVRRAVYVAAGISLEFEESPVVELPWLYRSEAQMRDALGLFAKYVSTDCDFVAEVSGARYWVRFSRQTVIVDRLVASPESNDAEHSERVRDLWDKSPDELLAARVEQKSKEGYSDRAVPHVFYFPDATVKQLHDDARRTGRSFSWLVRCCWELATSGVVAIETYEASQVQLVSRVAKQELVIYLPKDVIARMQEKAERLGYSVSRVVEIAITLARGKMGVLRRASNHS